MRREGGGRREKVGEEREGEWRYGRVRQEGGERRENGRGEGG